MVIDGILEIEIDGRIVSAKPGEIIYIPKDSHIHVRLKLRNSLFQVYPSGNRFDGLYPRAALERLAYLHVISYQSSPPLSATSATSSITLSL